MAKGYVGKSFVGSCFFLVLILVFERRRIVTKRKAELLRVGEVEGQKGVYDLKEKREEEEYLSATTVSSKNVYVVHGEGEKAGSRKGKEREKKGEKYMWLPCC